MSKKMSNDERLRNIFKKELERDWEASLIPRILRKFDIALCKLNLEQLRKL